MKERSRDMEGARKESSRVVAGQYCFLIGLVEQSSGWCSEHWFNHPPQPSPASGPLFPVALSAAIVAEGVNG